MTPPSNSALGYLLAGSAAGKITWRGHTTTSGRPVYGGRRTIAHLEATDQAARARFGAGVLVLQGAYNTGVAASAGTHDRDGVVDVYIPGVDWWTQQRFLREHGWAAWYRYPPTFSHHIHMVSLGCPGPLGIYVPGQIDDYYAHRSGLAGHAADNTWHPADIRSTVFDYPAWVRDQEDDMPYTEKQLQAIFEKAIEAKLDQIAGATSKKLLGTDLTPSNDDNDTTVRGALNKAASRR